MMVDIGEVLAVVGIAPEGDGQEIVDTIAIGSSGTVRFAFLPAVSRGRIVTPHGELWSAQLRMFLDQCAAAKREELSVGELVTLAPLVEALGVLCAKRQDNPSLARVGEMLDPSARYEWVNAKGEPVEEPKWFRESRRVFESEFRNRG